jgi:hypothetical protein
MTYLTGAYETMETADLLAELSHAEQMGFAGEIAVMELKEEIEKRFADRVQTIEEKEVTEKPVKAEAVEAVTIDVFYEAGYKWSVWVNDQSVDSSMTKKEAMALARKIKKENKNAVINEQKLTKAEKAENISWLHEHSYNYKKF